MNSVLVFLLLVATVRAYTPTWSGSSGGGSTSGGSQCSYSMCAGKIGLCAAVCYEGGGAACIQCMGASATTCCACLPTSFQRYCGSRLRATESVTYCEMNRTMTDVFGETGPFESVVVVPDTDTCETFGGTVADVTSANCTAVKYGNYALETLSDTCGLGPRQATLRLDLTSLLTVHDSGAGPLTAIKFGTLGGCFSRQAGIDVIYQTDRSVLVDLTADPNGVLETVTLTYNAGESEECAFVFGPRTTVQAGRCSQRCPDGSSCSVSCPYARCSCLGGLGHQAWCSC